MAKGKNEGIYTGYVIDNNKNGGYNPVQVWIPSLDGNYVMGEWISFGANTGSAIDCTVLQQLKAIVGNKGYFYRTCPVQAESNNGSFLEDDCSSLVNQAAWQWGGKAEDLTTSSSNSNYSGISMPGAGSSFFPDWNVGGGLFSTYVLGDTHGIKADSYAGQPQGEYSTIGVGTPVLVCFADSGSTGYILAQLPSVANYNNGVFKEAAKMKA